jgi:hypothetical protein
MLLARAGRLFGAANQSRGDAGCTRAPAPPYLQSCLRGRAARYLPSFADFAVLPAVEATPARRPKGS